MAGKKKSKSATAAVSAGRIIGGVFVLSLGFSGARGALLVDRSHATGVIVTIMGILVSILFVLLGFAMIVAGVPKRKKRRKVSPEKLDTRPRR